MGRIEFSVITKRTEWLKAAGTDNANKVLVKYLADHKVPAKMPRSKCRVCKMPLTWGSGTYAFDHLDNRSYNISQRNCFLVCRNDHGKATKTKVIRHYNPYFGGVDYTSTIKLKDGYKKTARKPVKKTVKKPTRKTAEKPAHRTARKPVRKTTRKGR